MIKNKGNVGILLIFLLVSVGVLAGVFYWRFGGKFTGIENTASTAGITPTPTPIPLHKGAGKYAVTQSKHVGPTFSSVTLDPLDVKKGQQFTITVEVADADDIQQLSGSLQSDNTSTDLAFSKLDGSTTNGSWQTKINLQDSVFYTYIVTLTAKSKNGVSTIKVSPR